MKNILLSLFNIMKVNETVKLQHDKKRCENDITTLNVFSFFLSFRPAGVKESKPQIKTRTTKVQFKYSILLFIGQLIQRLVESLGNRFVILHWEQFPGSFEPLKCSQASPVPLIWATPVTLFNEPAFNAVEHSG